MQRAAVALGARAIQDVDTVPDVTATALLVQLDLDDAMSVVRRWREASPELTIVGYLSTPDPEAWREAEAAGAEVVTTRGRADTELVRRVHDRLSGRRHARRLRLAAHKDFAGRLGFVGRIDETPSGPIAIFHVDNRLHAVADTCPHAGASLCTGDLEGDVLTCPAHGSQFCVSDGARVRGPADEGLQRFPVIVEAGEVFIELPERP